uniref:Uncharacterized protein n=2 Tax=Tetranychus urticae TaxID=32264 RepID=T1KLQ2_TETUR
MFIKLNDAQSATIRERHCRKTHCGDNRPIYQVFEQCRREFNSNAIRRERCADGRLRYRCCEACANVPCSNAPFNIVDPICTDKLAELVPPDPRTRSRLLLTSVSRRNCGINGYASQCCLS